MNKIQPGTRRIIRTSLALTGALSIFFGGSVVASPANAAFATPGSAGSFGIPAAPEANPAPAPANTPTRDQIAALFAKSPLTHAPKTPQRSANAGTIVTNEPVQLLLNSQLWNVKASRITYNSTDSLSRPSVDSGIYVEPNVPWTGPGPRPIVAISPGTQGGAEKCDPSLALQTGLQITINPVDAVAPYEALPLFEHLQRGAAVVMVDHHRNSDGHQEYVDNITAGQTLLDGAAAAVELSGNPQTPVALYGYSQGGAGSAAAAERAAVYAPELNIVAAAAGGVPSNLTEVLDKIDGTSLTGVLPLSLSAILDKDPELREALYAAEMTPKAAVDLDRPHQMCAGGDMAAFGFHSTREWTKDGISLGEMIAKYPEFKVELERQKIGSFKPSMPTLLYNGTHDDLIPVGQARELRDQWQALGTNLSYYEDPLAPVLQRTGANHMLTLVGNIKPAADFLWQHIRQASQG
nr:lipase family protein [Corynebacterium lactis]